MMTREGGAQPKEYLAKYAADRVRTVAITWLGSTMGCAECHDHKFDPFTPTRLLLAGRLLRRRQAVGRLLRLRLHAQPRAEGLDQRPPVPARDRGGEPVPEAAAGAAASERIRRSAREAASRLAADADRSRTRSRPGSRTCAELVKTSPDGWKTPRRSRPRQGAKRRAPTAACVLADRRRQAAEWQAGRRLDVPAEARRGWRGRDPPGSAAAPGPRRQGRPRQGRQRHESALGVDPLEGGPAQDRPWRSSTPRPT